MIEQKFESSSVLMETVLQGIDENILKDQNDNKDGELDDTLKSLLDDIDQVFKDLKLE
tara:strand:+ start:289 stop:462 length:174 start_codon:yes stop_codon:yes gene_type:complete